MEYQDLPDASLFLDPTIEGQTQYAQIASDDLVATIRSRATSLSCIPELGQHCLVSAEIVSFTGEPSGTAIVPSCERGSPECARTCQEFSLYLNDSHYKPYTLAWYRQRWLKLIQGDEDD